MSTFLERYLDGEHAAVWAELIGLGDQVRQKPVLRDAEAVAGETMRRARYNIETLIPRLAAVGYRFAAPTLEKKLQKINETIANPQLNPYVREQLERAVKQGKADPSVLDPAKNLSVQTALVGKREQKVALEAELARMKTMPPLENPRVYYEPEKQTAEFLKTMEKMAKGPIPLSLKAWYQHIGHVSFMGSHEVLNPDGNSIADPLVMDSLEQLCKQLVIGRIGEVIHMRVSVDEFRKADVASGKPLGSPPQYGVTIPNASADWILDTEWGSLHFVGYLRKTFQWAGFPGWERDPGAPRELISKLTEDLLPL